MAFVLSSVGYGLGLFKKRPTGPMDFFRDPAPPDPAEVARKVMTALGHPDAC